MNWKQPIPVGLEEIFGKDYLCQALYKELIYRSANKDGVWSMGDTLAEIKRGQVIFGRIQFSKYLGWSASRVERTLKKLVQKADIITVIKRDKNCSVIYINNYESITKMDMTSDINRTSIGHQSDTSKSVKSVIKENIEKKYTSQNLTIEEVAEQIKKLFEKVTGRPATFPETNYSNLAFWLGIHSPEDITKAIKNIPKDEYWCDIMTPTILFRRYSQQHQPVDFIGSLLNQKKKKSGTSFDDIVQSSKNY